MPSNTSKLLTTKEAADRLNITPYTLNVWRYNKRYALPYVKVGCCVRYKDSDIETFINKRTKGDVI